MVISLVELAIGLVCAAVGFGLGYWRGCRRLTDSALGILNRTDRMLREARLNADITRDVDI